jgi:thiamine biosynthesis lipoprotein
MTPALPELLFAMTLVSGESARAGSTPVAREVRLVMGTTAEVEANGPAEPSLALAAAFAALTRVDDALSLWKPSELQRLNDAGEGHPSRELRAVLESALEIAAASGGAFDPTVEPLVRARGGLGTAPLSLSPDERASLLARVGYQKVHLDSDSGRVRLESGTRLDFGGIAKGYAADLALAALRSAGAAAGFVSLGESNLGLFGKGIDLEVRDPEAHDGEGGQPWAIFRVEEGAVSSSAADQKGAHILDPRTGEPAGGLLSSTVVTATGIEADALSTAVLVLGADAGLRLLEQRGAAGFVLLRQAGARVLRATRGFAREHALKLAPGVSLRE